MKEWKVLSVLLTVATEEHIKRKYIAEWSSLVARRAHNPKVPGAKPGSATIVLPVEVSSGATPLWTPINYREVPIDKELKVSRRGA